jgi:hypothetical protein
MRAKGPGVLPAKGTALVIGSPLRDNPFSITFRPNGPTILMPRFAGRGERAGEFRGATFEPDAVRQRLE